MKTKTLVLFFLLFFFFESPGQRKLYDVVSEQTCECLAKVEKTGGVSHAGYKECLSFSLNSNLSAIAAEVVEQFGGKATMKKVRNTAKNWDEG